MAEAYKINRTGLRTFSEGEWVLINPDDYDIIVERAGTGYATAKYRVIKNAPGLSSDELADICNPNNFGHRWEGDKLVVYTD